MKQGDIYWYTFHAPDKRRPVLVLTRTSAISYLTSVTVAQITTTIRKIPSEVLLTPEADGVFEDCVVNAHNIQTIQKPGSASSLRRYRQSECMTYTRRLSLH
jgi:mRNA interferase MazF